MLFQGFLEYWDHTGREVPHAPLGNHLHGMTIASLILAVFLKENTLNVNLAAENPACECNCRLLRPPVNSAHPKIFKIL